MKHGNNEGFNDHFYYWTHYRKEIAKAGFTTKVLFPLELHKFLSGELSDNCKTRYKKILLGIATRIYGNKLGKQLVRAVYPVSLYFIGSHAVILAEKRD